MIEALAAASLNDLARVESVEGWLGRTEIELLLGRAALVRSDHVIVEIGNYRGRSTVALALGARRGARARVYSIDPHLEFIGPRGGRFGPEDQAELYANLTRAGVGAEVHVVCLDSRAVAASWSGPRVGLLFIDGDHRYGAVRADLDAWRPHLAPEADVLFDDCDFPDVARLVRERVSAGQLVARAGAGKVGWFAVREGKNAETRKGDAESAEV
jgi:predicted O-methyltransferase YrrM